MSPHTPVQPLPTRRRKVSIEIYFVLYLSAIILLLGTTPARHNGREEKLEEVIRHLLVSDFKLRVDKVALEYNFIPVDLNFDTAGVVLRRDSLNEITARGTFSHVEFRVVSIEDSSSGQPLPLEHALLLKGKNDRSAIFKWNPSASDHNGVYRVTIAGIASPLPPPSLRGELREQVAEILRRKGTVTDSVTFTVNVYAVLDQAMLRRITQATPSPSAIDTTPTMAGGRIDTVFQSLGSSPFSGQGFDFNVGDVDVAVPPGRAWRNRIMLGGGASTNDLTLSVSPTSVQIVEQTASMVELGGMAPMKGSQQITLSGVRKSDGRTVSASFTVRTVAASAPNVPNSMYAGTEYRLNFASEGLPAERLAVEVVENGRTVVARDEGRSIFKYTAGAPGNVRFIRYLDNQRLDEWQADLVAAPRPTTYQPQAERGAGEAVVTTIAYGYINGQPNKVALKIKSGNAEEPEQIDERFDTELKQTVQRWRVRRKDRSSEFAFVTYSIDQRGSKSGKSSEVSFAVR